MTTTAQILLVEDDTDQRAAVAQVLRAEGYAVTESESAEDALEILERQRFDLMIADYQLGGATGAWLVRVATSSMSGASLRALLMTAHEGVPDTEGLTVMAKPLDFERLVSTVATALSPERPHNTPHPPSQRIAFILYVNDSESSRRTRETLETLLAPFEPAQIALTIVDVSTESPNQAEEHRIVATPTLLKTFPAPRIWISGDLANSRFVLRLLEQAGVEPVVRG